MKKRKSIKKRLQKFGGNPNKMAGCDGKIRYETYEKAKADAESLIDAHAYKCPYCRFYHKGRIQ